jgi:hypothetical protein
MADETSYHKILLWESPDSLCRITFVVCACIVEARDKLVPDRRGVLKCMECMFTTRAFDRGSWYVSAEHGLLLSESKELDLNRSKVDRFGRCLDVKYSFGSTIADCYGVHPAPNVHTAPDHRPPTNSSDSATSSDGEQASRDIRHGYSVADVLLSVAKTSVPHTVHNTTTAKVGR